MNLLSALKEKLLLLYILTFVMGTVFYTTILFIPSTEQTEFIPVLKAYFLSFYVFIFGYIVLKAYKAIRADEEEKVKDDTAIVNDTEIVSFAEVRELTRYAAAYGIDKEVSSLLEGSLEKNKATILCQLTVLLNEWETEEYLSHEKMCQVVVLYAELNLLTPENITGKTLCDSHKVDQVTQPLLRVTWRMIFPLILLNVFLDGWFQDMIEPEEGFWFYLIAFQRYVLNYLNPFLWGAMGSCVYLLKIYSDLAENNLFNEDKLQGWGTRVTLGAILGGVVQFIYDSSVFTNTGMNLDANAIGFLTGIGVKVVYGSLEKTIESFSSLMNLDSIKKDSGSRKEIRRYLNEKLSALGESAEDQQKRKVIQEILSELNSKS